MSDKEVQDDEVDQGREEELTQKENGASERINDSIIPTTSTIMTTTTTVLISDECDDEDKDKNKTNNTEIERSVTVPVSTKSTSIDNNRDVLDVNENGNNTRNIQEDYDNNINEADDDDDTSVLVYHGGILSGQDWFRRGGKQTLEHILIDNNVKAIDMRSFTYCQNLNRIDFLSSTTIRKCNTSLSSSSSSNNDNDEPNATVGVSDASPSSSLSSIPSPNLKCIGRSAFYFCTSLIHVNLNMTRNNIREICNRAFQHCHSLREFIFPTTLERIGSNAFADCKQLQTIDIPISVHDIGAFAFAGCEELYYVNFPTLSIQKMDDGLFANCYKLSSIKFYSQHNQQHQHEEQEQKRNHSKNNNNDGMMKQRLQVEEYIVDKKGKKMEDQHVENEREESSIESLLDTIGSLVFYKCISLKSIHLPTSIKRIEEDAFNNCTSLIDISIFSSNQNQPQYSYCHLESIGRGAFHRCYNLISITIPNSVSTIHSYAFKECTSLQAIHLSNSIHTIGNKAFFDCDRLECIYLPETIERFVNTSRNGGASSRIDLEYRNEKSKTKKRIDTRLILFLCDLNRGGIRFLQRRQEPSNDQEEDDDDDEEKDVNESSIDDINNIKTIEKSNKKEKKQKQKHKTEKVYPLGLWPLILYRTLHIIDMHNTNLKLFSVNEQVHDLEEEADNDDNDDDTNGQNGINSPTMILSSKMNRRLSVIYTLLVHSGIWDYIHKNTNNKSSFGMEEQKIISHTNNKKTKKTNRNKDDGDDDSYNGDNNEVNQNQFKSNIDDDDDSRSSSILLWPMKCDENNNDYESDSYADY